MLYQDLKVERFIDADKAWTASVSNDFKNDQSWIINEFFKYIHKFYLKHAKPQQLHG